MAIAAIAGMPIAQVTPVIAAMATGEVQRGQCLVLGCPWKDSELTSMPASLTLTGLALEVRTGRAPARWGPR